MGFMRRSSLLHCTARTLRAAVALTLPVLLPFALAACGGSSEAPAPAVDPAVAARDAEQQQRLHDLELQLESLAHQSEAMRREVLSRLDQIDVTREALAIQISNLQGEVGGATPPPPPTAPAAAAPDSRDVAAPPTPAASAADAPAPAAAAELAPEDGNNPFLRFLLLIFILGAIFFLGRIFFDRWGDPEDGDRPPAVETTTDLGKIRFPPGTEAHPGDDGDRGSADDDEDGGRPGD